MNIFPKALLTSLLIFLPSVALAVFVSPGNLMLSSFYSDKPMEFDYELYFRSDQTEDIQITASMRGALEGKRLERMRTHTSGNIQIINEGDVMSGYARIIIHDGTFYIRFDDASFYYQNEYRQEISFLEESLAPLLDKWYSMPLDELLEEVGSYDGGTTDSLAPVFESAQTEAENPMDVVAGLFDRVYEMERSNYYGGKAYTLTLKPDFLYRTVSFLEKITNSNTDGSSESFGEAHGEAEILQEILADNVVSKFKIDTNNYDGFKSARYYIDFKIPDNGVEFAINGGMKHSQTPVHLDVPINTASMEEEVLLELHGTSSVVDNDEDDNTGEDEYEDEVEYKFEYDEVEMQPAVSANCRTANPVLKARMQRSGQCRVDRVSRRVLKGE